MKKNFKKKLYHEIFWTGEGACGGGDGGGDGGGGVPAVTARVGGGDGGGARMRYRRNIESAIIDWLIDLCFGM